MSDRDKKPSYTDYDENRLDWREKDRRKDQRNVDEARKSLSPKQKYRDDKAKKDYLKNLDNLFKGKKGGKTHDQEVKLLKESFSNKEKFKESLEHYEKTYGFPTDWDLLLLILKMNNSQRVTQTLQILRQEIPHVTDTKKQILKSEIEILRMTMVNRELRMLFDEFYKEFYS